MKESIKKPIKCTRAQVGYRKNGTCIYTDKSLSKKYLKQSRIMKAKSRSCADAVTYSDNYQASRV